MRPRGRRWIWIVPVALLAIPVVALIGGESVKVLWNWLLPPLLGWRPIGFWQALGLLVLTRILFGGVRSTVTGRRAYRCPPEPASELL